MIVRNKGYGHKSIFKVLQAAAKVFKCDKFVVITPNHHVKELLLKMGFTLNKPFAIFFKPV